MSFDTIIRGGRVVDGSGLPLRVAVMTTRPSPASGLTNSPELLALLMNTELYRMPLVLSGKTYAFAFLIIAAAVGLSGLLILRRLYNLDLIAVLKTRE